MSETTLKVAKVKDPIKMLGSVLPVEQIVLVNADVLPLEQVAQVTIDTISEELTLLLEAKKRIAELPKVTDVSQIAEMADWQQVAKELQKLRTSSVKKLDAAKRKYMETDRQIVKIRNTVEATFEALEEEARQNGEFLKRIQDAEADAEAQRRLDSLAVFGYHAKTFKELRAMDAEVFEAFAAKVESDYQKAIEAEKAQKEAAERAEKERQLQLRNTNRQRLVAPYAHCFNGNYAEMSEEEFEAAFASAKLEAEEKEAQKSRIRAERVEALKPYASFAIYHDDLGSMVEQKFQHILQYAKDAKADYDKAEAEKAEKARIEAEARAKEEAERAAKEAEERAIAKAKADAEAAEKARIEAEKAEIARKEAEAKAKAEVLAKAGDGEKMKHFAEALKEALKEAPASLETEQARKELAAIVERLNAFTAYISEKY